MRWNHKVAAAAGLSALLVATTACAGAGGAGGGGGGGGGGQLDQRLDGQQSRRCSPCRNTPASSPRSPASR